MFNPGIVPTAIVLAAAFALGLMAHLQLRRPFESRIWPLFPWVPVMFLALLLILVSAGHLIGLLSGVPFGRQNF